MFKVNAVRLIERIIKKFDLSLTPQSKELEFSETIVPVTLIDSTLDDVRTVQKTITVTAIGFQSLDVVPAGERWKVIQVFANLSTGTYTMNRIAVVDRDSNALTMQYFPTPATDIYGDMKDFYVEEGEALSVYVDSKTGNGNLVVTARVIVERWKR